MDTSNCQSFLTIPACSPGQVPCEYSKHVSYNSPFSWAYSYNLGLHKQMKNSVSICMVSEVTFK